MSFVHGCQANRGEAIAAEVRRLRSLYSPGSTHLHVPFLGWAGVCQHLSSDFYDIDIGDSSEDIMAMWTAIIRQGWVPEDSCCEEQYQYLSRLRPGITSRRAFFGAVCCTYGAPFTGTFRSSQDFPYVEEAIDYVNRARPRMRNMNLKEACCYTTCTPHAGDTMYLDPPHDDASFDMAEFYEKCREWTSQGVLLAISTSCTPPSDFRYVSGPQCEGLYVHCDVGGNGWEGRCSPVETSDDEQVLTDADIICPLCAAPFSPGDATYVVRCCDTKVHCACLSTYLRVRHTSTCPHCHEEMWPDFSDDESYCPSSEESDDHYYEETVDGIDVDS